MPQEGEVSPLFLQLVVATATKTPTRYQHCVGSRGNDIYLEVFCASVDVPSVLTRSVKNLKK